MGGPMEKSQEVGKGAGGAASLWVLYDTETGNIVDKLVLKDAVFAQEKRDAASSIFFHEDDVTGDIHPFEAVIQKRLTDGREKYSVALFAYKTIPNRRLSRYYMEHAPFGDVWDSMKDPAQNPFFCLGLRPEAFIWSVFYAAVKVLISLRDGPPRWGAEESPWNPVIHRDIKLANIFLVEPRDSSSKLTTLPTPVVADYGHAAELPTDLPDETTGDYDIKLAAHLERFTNDGTPWHMSPESWQKSPRIALPDGEEVYNIPGPHWDVYALGTTILGLMDTDEKYTENLVIWHYIGVFYQGPDLDDLYIHEEYSTELRDLVKACMKNDFRERPKLEDLLVQTKRARDRWAKKEWKYGSIEYNPMGPDYKRLGTEYRRHINVRDYGLHGMAEHGDILEEPFWAGADDGVERPNEAEADEEREADQEEEIDGGAETGHISRKRPSELNADPDGSSPKRPRTSPQADQQMQTEVEADAEEEDLEVSEFDLGLATSALAALNATQSQVPAPSVARSPAPSGEVDEDQDQEEEEEDEIEDEDRDPEVEDEEVQHEAQDEAQEEVQVEVEDKVQDKVEEEEEAPEEDEEGAQAETGDEDDGDEDEPDLTTLAASASAVAVALQLQVPAPVQSQLPPPPPLAAAPPAPAPPAPTPAPPQLPQASQPQPAPPLRRGTRDRKQTQFFKPG